MGIKQRIPFSLSILIVEPLGDGADTLAEMLLLGGHEVTVARTGAEALAATIAATPDVILLEVRLPDFNGWDVAWRLREPLPGCRRPLMVAVTTCSTFADRKRSAEAGIDLHLVKPVRPDCLMEVLARWGRLLISDSNRELAPPDSCKGSLLTAYFTTA